LDIIRAEQFATEGHHLLDSLHQIVRHELQLICHCMHKTSCYVTVEGLGDGQLASEMAKVFETIVDVISLFEREPTTIKELHEHKEMRRVGWGGSGPL
jgi:hypothetical protein